MALALFAPVFLSSVALAPQRESNGKWDGPSWSSGVISFGSDH